MGKDMSQILCIDTSTEACSVAVSTKDNQEIISEYRIAPRKHAELILGQIDSVLAKVQLKPEQLDAFAVTVGPGAFTGVRLGIAVAQGLAFAADLKIISVGTLETLAMTTISPQSIEGTKIAVAIDARMGEVYWGCFQWSNNTLVSLKPNRVCSVNSIDFKALNINKHWLFAGTGWAAQAEQFENLMGFVPDITQESLLPSAKTALLLAQKSINEAVSAELIEPVYLRDKVAETTIERMSKKKLNLRH